MNKMVLVCALMFVVFAGTARAQVDHNPDTCEACQTYTDSGLFDALQEHLSSVAEKARIEASLQICPDCNVFRGSPEQLCEHLATSGCKLHLDWDRFSQPEPEAPSNRAKNIYLAKEEGDAADQVEVQEKEIGARNVTLSANLGGRIFADVPAATLTVVASGRSNLSVAVMINGIVLPRDLLVIQPGLPPPGLVLFNNRMLHASSVFEALGSKDAESAPENHDPEIQWSDECLFSPRKIVPIEPTYSPPLP